MSNETRAQVSSWWAETALVRHHVGGGGEYHRWRNIKRWRHHVSSRKTRHELSICDEYSLLVVMTQHESETWVHISVEWNYCASVLTVNNDGRVHIKALAKLSPQPLSSNSILLLLLSIKVPQTQKYDTYEELTDDLETILCVLHFSHW